MSESNTNKAGTSGGGAYQNIGVGNSESVATEATNKASGVGAPGSEKSQGETEGVGSIYSAQLNERPNLSNPRNRGPERSPSAVGSKALPIISASSRKTGRTG